MIQPKIVDRKDIDFDDHTRKMGQLAGLQLYKAGKWTQKTKHNLPGCVQKTFDYLGAVSKERFEIEFSWKNREYKYSYEPVDELRIADNLFRQYSCLDYGCSRCCWYIGFWNVFSGQQFTKMREKYGQSQTESYLPLDIHFSTTTSIEPKTLWVSNHSTNQTICNHLDKKTNACGIHEENPLHCAFPLVKFRRTKNKTTITRMPFGRNTTTIQCPAQFEKMTANSVNNTIKLLEKVIDFGGEYGVRTHLPESIKEIKNLWKEYNIHQLTLKEVV